MNTIWWIYKLSLLTLIHKPNISFCAGKRTKFIIFADADDKTTKYISLDVNRFIPRTLFRHLGNQRPIALEFDPVEDRVYWSDNAQGVIRSAFFNATSMKTLFHCNVQTPDGIAIDHVGRNIYWTDTGTNRIEVGGLDGTKRKLLFKDGLDEPRAIVLDERNGMMYWTDWGANPKIEQAEMDGSARQTIVTGSLGWPTGLTIDQATNRLFWADAYFDRIEAANLNGRNRHLIMSSTTNIIPFGLAVYQNVLYWTDWGNKSVSRYNLSSGRQDMIVTGLKKPMGIYVFDPSLTFSGPRNCSQNRGLCSDFCLLKPGGYQCACPTGIALKSDGRTCDYDMFYKTSSGKFMIFAEADCGEIYKVPLSVPGTPCYPLRIKTSISRPVAVDYDPVEGRIYWTDVRLQHVARAFPNGSSVEIIAYIGVNIPNGLAVDYVKRAVFWTDEGTSKIEVARLDGSSRIGLITSRIEKPRAILLDISERKMYWGSRGSSPKIEQANMDGSDRKVLVSSGLFWVNSLALDYQNGLLYWCDALFKRIERIDLQGNTRKMILDLFLDNRHPFGLSLSGYILYWSDWNTKSIHQYDMKSLVHKDVVRGMGRPMELHIYDHTHTFDVNHCPQLMAPVNGNMQPCSNLTGQTCHFSCDSGYNLTGSTIRRCRSNGTWTGSQTQCNVNRCSQLMAPANGSMKPCSNLPGHTCQFSCDKGYNLTGPTTRRCNSNGTWTGTRPKCNMSRCQQLIAPANGSMQQCSNLPGQTCRFSCGKGFNLTGSTTRRCISNGTWTGTQPQCNVIPTQFINDNGNGEHEILHKDTSTTRRSYIAWLAFPVSLVCIGVISATAFCVRRYRAGERRNHVAGHNVAHFQNEAFSPDDMNQQSGSHGAAGASRNITTTSNGAIPGGSTLPAERTEHEVSDSHNQKNHATIPDSLAGDAVDCWHYLGKVDEPVTQGQCFNISTHVGVNWKDVLRKLSMNETIIRNLEEDYKHCKVVEKCYQGLLAWKEIVGSQNATSKKLCNALRLVGCSEALKPNLWKEDASNSNNC